MKILLVHNEYGKVSGEEIVVRSIRQLLEEYGHQTSCYFRSSAELDGRPASVAKAFFTGIYNFSSKRVIRDLLSQDRPDIVHVHNVFPLISPSILGACRRAGVPVVMTVHNYRLVCPNGLHMHHGKVCEQCVGGREYRCVVNRCEGSLAKSAGYALRNAVARKMRFFHDNVTVYAALTQFQRTRLIAAGFAADRIHVVPNMVNDIPPGASDDAATIATDEQYVGYVGRVSPEKGIPVLLAAAAKLPHVRFHLAGDHQRMPELVTQAPPNVRFLGHLGAADLDNFYRRARIIVLCSTCFEGFPVVLAEAMLHGKPVVCSRTGGLPEIVDDGTTGFLCTPGSEDELAGAISRLWDNPDLCRRMGQAGREKARDNYSRSRYYERLTHVYSAAIELAGRNGN